MQDPGGSGASAHALVYRVRSLALLWKERVLGATVDSGGPTASGLLMGRTVSPSSNLLVLRYPRTGSDRSVDKAAFHPGEKKSKNEGGYIYISLIHFAVQQKLKEHCKATLLQ